MKLKFILLVITSGLIVGCSTTKVTKESQLASGRTSKPTVIYVADFELQAASIKHQKGMLPFGAEGNGPIPLPLPGLSKSPEARARELVNLMSESIVKDLRKAGFNATRIATKTTPPANGWLIRGVFTEVQEGNRLQRAMIGFGKGATDLQVVTTSDDLSSGKPKPFYEIETDATSGKSPGAAPTLILGPYGAAARFVMAGKDLDRNVKSTAAKIAASVSAQVDPSKLQARR